MCGRTALTLDKQEIIRKTKLKENQNTEVASHKNRVSSSEKEFNTDTVNDGSCDEESSLVPVWNDAPCGNDYIPSPNIAPTLYTPVLYKKGNNVTLQPMMWGMIPPWHPGPDAKSHGLSTNNCRLESVISSKLYSPCLNSRRCVIVCEGFYEWLRQGSEKQPFLVSRPPKDDCEEGKQLLYMAGLYSIWQEKVYSYTILTRESNKTLSWLHHRMPCFLHPGQVSEWLDTETNVDSAMKLLERGLPVDGDLAWHKVSKSVGNSRNQDIKLMEEVKEEVKEKKMDNVMANWLKSPSNNCGTVTNIDRSKNIKPNKPINKSKNLMNNWLKRPNSNASENEIDDKKPKM